jgi:peptidoglycan-associated lipoprotein
MILQGPVKTGEPKQGLFFSKRTDKQSLWSDPKPLQSINAAQGEVGTCSPCLSADNKFLYFASDRPGGKGGLDLYVVAVNEIEELRK